MVLNSYNYPPKQGLYLPEFETAACGVGFVVKIDGQRSHQVWNLMSVLCRVFIMFSKNTFTA